MIDYTVTEHNAETGEIVIREMTTEEKLLVDLRHQKWQEEIQKENELNQQRQELLAKLGITQEEAKLLLS
jgi:uncharacterized protein YjiS (DUF1127 family)